LLVASQALTLGTAPKHVRIRLLQGGRGCLGSNTRRSGEVEHFIVGHPELLGELVDTDLLRRHVSIQPFPVVIPSPLCRSAGALFVVSKRGTNGFEVWIFELRAPCPAELTLEERSFETVRFSLGLAAHRCTAQPGAASAACAVDHEGRPAVV